VRSLAIGFAKRFHRPRSLLIGLHLPNPFPDIVLVAKEWPEEAEFWPLKAGAVSSIGAAYTINLTIYTSGPSVCCQYWTSRWRL
jgi:hypothetical protein